MNILCTICARGGSEGIKNKNLIKFDGKPLIDIAINKANKINKINKIVISTDSDQIIKSIQGKNLNKIIKRPKYLALKHIAKFDVWKHALIKAEKIYKTKFDLIIDIDCSNPLQRTSSIEELLNTSLKMVMQKQQFDCVLFICEARKNPYFNLFEKQNEFLKISKKLKSVIKSRQKAPAVFEHVAGSYVLKRNFLLKCSNLNEGKLIGVNISRKESIDIDDMYDFKISSLINKNFNEL